MLEKYFIASTSVFAKVLIVGSILKRDVDLNSIRSWFMLHSGKLTSSFLIVASKFWLDPRIKITLTFLQFRPLTGKTVSMVENKKVAHSATFVSCFMLFFMFFALNIL